MLKKLFFIFLLTNFSLSFSWTVVPGTVSLGTYNSSSGNTTTYQNFFNSGGATGGWSWGTSGLGITNSSNNSCGYGLLNMTLYTGAANTCYVAGLGTYNGNDGVSAISYFNVAAPTDGTTNWPLTPFLKIVVPSGQNLPAGQYQGSLTYSWNYKGCWGCSTSYYTFYQTVTMTVNNSCTISTSGISFGNILGSSDTNITAIVNSNCTYLSSYSISSDGGNSTNILSRTMKNGSNILNYQLYIDSGYSTIWGNGTTGSNINLVGTGSNQATSIYGKVIAGQRPTPGNYSDTINITLTY